MMFRKPELSRRDFDFLCERLDHYEDLAKTALRLMETQERAHAAELKAMSQRLDISEARLTALDAWTQTIATARGLGSPSPSIETMYEGFEEVEGEFDFEDGSLEALMNVGIGPVPLPQTENSPVDEKGEA